MRKDTLSAVSDQVCPVRRIDDSRERNPPTKSEIVTSSFLAVKKGVPDGFICILCSCVLAKMAQATFVGLRGRYIDRPAFGYVVHTECALSNMDLLLTLESPSTLPEEL